MAAPKTTVSASVDALKSELHVARQTGDAAKRENKVLENERQKLVEQVVSLESQRRTLHQDAEHWKKRCLGFEQECASMGAREDAVHAKLREAHTRERSLAISSIEGRIAIAEVENAQATAQSEKREMEWRAQELGSKLGARCAEVETLRSEAIELRTQKEARRLEVDNLNAQLRDVKTDRDMHKEALVESERRQAALEERVKGLESGMQTASMKHTEFAKEVEKHREDAFKAEETNKKLRLDLQQAITQAVRAGEVPFYSGGGGRFQAPNLNPACIEDLKEAPTMGAWKTNGSNLPLPLTPSSPMSARSRLDYPKSARARELRHKVLSARGEALDYIDQLNLPG